MMTTDSCFLEKEGIYQRRGKGEAQYGENIAHLRKIRPHYLKNFPLAIPAGIVLEKFTSAAEKNIYPFCLFLGIYDNFFKANEPKIPENVSARYARRLVHV